MEEGPGAGVRLPTELERLRWRKEGRLAEALKELLCMGPAVENVLTCSDNVLQVWLGKCRSIARKIGNQHASNQMVVTR